MSALEVRGGVPMIYRNASVPTAAAVHHRWPAWTKYVVFRNKGSTALRVYIHQADADNDTANYLDVPVASAAQPHGEWRGPVESREIWIKSITSAGSVEAIGFQKRA